MKLILLVVLVAVVSGSSDISTEEVDAAWTRFKLENGKRYRSVYEESVRKFNFIENYNAIAEHNKRYEQGLVKYTQKINHFADMTHAEIEQTLSGYQPGNIEGREFITSVFSPNLSVSVPDSFDWRDRGAVTDVKNQGTCAGGWAFSVTGALEGQYFLKTGQLVSLSEQNVIDCASAVNPGPAVGCSRGGNSNKAYMYVNINDGIDSEDFYPYEAVDGSCRYNVAFNVTSVHGFSVIEQANEDHLKRAIATVGPVSIDMDTSHSSFTFYAGGIYYEPSCLSTFLDHAVLLVGYGSEDGQDYWIIKNSYGSNWGESGYMRIVRNKDNHCGVAQFGTFPINY